MEQATGTGKQELLNAVEEYALKVLRGEMGPQDVAVLPQILHILLNS